MPVTSKGTHYKVWYDQPKYNKHVWAFIHYCRNQGDRVHVRKKTNTMDVLVIDMEKTNAEKS
jgi:hypothetical protein